MSHDRWNFREVRAVALRGARFCDHGMVEDAAQEALISLYLTKPDLTEIEAKEFAFRKARSRAWILFRGELRRRQREAAVSREAPTVELRPHFRFALTQVPAAVRPVAYAVLQGMTVREIARALHVSPATAHRRVEELKRVLAANAHVPVVSRAS